MKDCKVGAMASYEFDEKAFQELLKSDIYSSVGKVNIPEPECHTSLVVSINPLKRVSSHINTFFEPGDLDDLELPDLESAETDFECRP